MDIREKLVRKQLTRIGLGTVMLAAGASKFIIPSYWTGYEPQILLNFIAVEQLMLAGGALETVLGITLISGRKTREAALATAVWLGTITLHMINLNFWALAIRDLGLTFYALTVYMLERAEGGI